MLTKYYFHTIIPIFKNMPKSGLIKCQWPFFDSHSDNVFIISDWVYHDRSLYQHDILLTLIS
jgi:hypothetical protein